MKGFEQITAGIITIGLIIAIVWPIASILNGTQDLEECNSNLDSCNKNCENLEYANSKYKTQLANTSKELEECNENLEECLNDLNLTKEECKQGKIENILMNIGIIIVISVSILFGVMVGVIIKPTLIKIVTKINIFGKKKIKK